MTISVGRMVASAFLFTAAGVGIAEANSVTVSSPFVMLDNVSANPEGAIVGNDIFFGANSVVPNGANGTTGLATVNTDPTFSRIINFQGQADLPNFFSREAVDIPALHGTWSLTFSNPSYSPTTAQVALAATQQVPFVSSVTITGNGQNPTISWTPPTNTQINGYRVNIYDASISNARNVPSQIFTENLAPNVTSFTVPSNGDLAATSIPITAGTSYYLEVQVLQTKDGASTDLNNANISARSRTFLNFEILPPSAPPTVYLPVTVASGSYQFNMQVTPGQTYYVDPSVAVGYVFKVNPGDPNFASVTLPSIQSSPFDLSYIFNGNLIDVLLNGGTTYTFLEAGGVDTFTVTGIDPSLGLDPSNPTAFITGLTFESGGNATVTQTAISSTPIPLTLPLFAGGLGILGLFMQRKKGATIDLDQCL